MNSSLQILAVTPGDIQRGIVIGSGLVGFGLAIMIVACAGGTWLDHLRRGWTWGDQRQPVGRLAIFCIGLSVATFGAFAICGAYQLLNGRSAAIFLLGALAPIFLGAFWQHDGTREDEPRPESLKCMHCGTVIDLKSLRRKCPRCGRPLELHQKN